jgi:ribose 5-phosphate isomerase A
MNAKKLAGEKAVELISDGMIVGLGTGSTAFWAIEKIGERVKEGLKIKAIATSKRSEEQARSHGVIIVDFDEINEIDITIDGADETDAQLNLIKGGGGALLREKIVATNSKQLIVVADESKLVKHLGKFPLPVEVNIFGWQTVFKKLKSFGCEPYLRMNESEFYLTDNGNYIIDCPFKQIQDAAALHNEINSIVGVVENGLFINIASKLIIAANDGSIKILEK